MREREKERKREGGGGDSDIDRDSDSDRDRDRDIETERETDRQTDGRVKTCASVLLHSASGCHSKFNSNIVLAASTILAVSHRMDYDRLDLTHQRLAANLKPDTLVAH